ncbi:endonuclease domain-containing protein [Micromonospora endolithica]|uniref:endonuclease domain-containing protein n=1 Tax=Micromonospora endolithica TaxID=230091 RepID=UPI0011AD8552|nr:type IV toxin-antitoxin system AbiEi family antitoxin [Micromonospora endolithica]TWJ20766.1 transcriptional regulator with AbiEi antitoxin domain of type IV toxin-antitoxin system [Micromonospora endolithica]
MFRGSRVLAQGLLTRAELRSGAWRPLFKDVYADARLAVSHPTRCAAAARWLIPPGAAIAGRSAAALFGAGRVEPHEPLDVLVPVARRFGPVAGLAVHTAAQVPGTDVARRAGVPVTTPERTCWDLAQWLRVEDAVALVDVLVRRRLVDPARLGERAHRHAGERGWRRMLRVAELTDGGAESPPESRLRVRLVLAGLPAPVTQFVVERNGAFVARLDLAWPQWKIAIEYDGIWHHDPQQLHRDRRRLNRLVGDDWIVLHLTSKRFATDFDGFLAEVRQAIRTRKR